MELIEYKIKRTIWLKCECDICQSTYDIQMSKENRRKKKKISAGRNVCAECVSEESKRRLVEAGTKALKNIDPETRRKNCSLAGKKAALVENSGRFTTERWNQMSKEEQSIQVNRATQAMQTKLASDEEFKKGYYKKIFKQLKIGYISKAHDELHDSIKHLGYEQNYQIEVSCVDECHPKLKIVIEYNGDFWHCNPEKWQENDYNKVIKMTAKEKWHNDFKRKMALKRRGYKVIVIWESEWNDDKQKCIDKILKETKLRQDEINKN